MACSQTDACETGEGRNVGTVLDDEVFIDVDQVRCAIASRELYSLLATKQVESGSDGRECDGIGRRGSVWSTLYANCRRSVCNTSACVPTTLRT